MRYSLQKPKNPYCRNPYYREFSLRVAKLRRRQLGHFIYQGIFPYESQHCVGGNLVTSFANIRAPLSE